LQEDIARSRDKVEKLLATIDELQSSDSTNQLSARRAERELREEKEKALRLEREIEILKTRGGSTMPQKWPRAVGSRAGTPALGEFSEDGLDIPKRKSSLRREMSLSKGFL